MVSNYTIDHVPLEIEMMSASSRVWIFQAERELTDKEMLQVTEYLRLFTQDWTAHNRQLRAHGGVFYKRFVVVLLDEESSNQASGCSIDNMTQQIQHLGKQLNADLMDRQNFYFLKDDGTLDAVNMHELTSAYSEGRVDDNSLVFNSLVKTKEEFFSQWLTPLKDSWHFKFV